MAKKRPAKVSQLLADMRYVYGHPWTQPESEGCVALRDMLRDNPEKFLAQLATLERAQQALEAKEAPEEPKKTEPMDEGSARCLELLDDWLREWDAENGRHRSETVE